MVLFYIVLLACAGVIISQQSSPESQHNILQSGQEFKQVLSCDASKQLYIASTDQALNSKGLYVTIDLHVHRPDFSQSFNASNPTAGRPEGRTRMTVGYTYELFQPSIVATIAYFDEPCQVASTGKVTFDASEAGEFTNLGDVVDEYLERQQQMLKNMSTQVTIDSSGQLNTSYELDEVIYYEAVLSAGLADENGNLMVCCELAPSFPSIPDTFSVIVEANIMNSGYSIAQHEYYSYEQDKTRVEVSSFRGDFVIISDYDSQLDHIISMPNATYPNGYCQDTDMNFFEVNFTSEVSGHVVNSRQFLLLNGDLPPVYEELSPPEIVRGVPCEKWSYSFDADGSGPLGLNGSYTVEMFFAHAFWRVPRNFGHRQLMRIKLLGYNYEYDEQVEHIYEYIDFKPFIPPYIGFDQCSVLPNGENCGCENTLQGNQGAVSVESNDDDDKCDGFPSEQAGAYVLFLIIGLLVGIGGGIGIWILKMKYFGGPKYKQFVISEQQTKEVEMANGVKSEPQASSTDVI